jgi:DNA-binding GntR family transcriptional regulator
MHRPLMLHPHAHCIKWTGPQAAEDWHPPYHPDLAQPPHFDAVWTVDGILDGRLMSADLAATPITLLRLELRMKNLDTAPLKPVTLRNRIVEVIRQAITSGDLNPGDRIVELRLAKQLGVGNTAVREALFELERAGLVTRIPNKGSFITKTTLEDAQQIFSVRKVLEALAVDLASEHMSPPYLDMLQGLVDAMRSAAEANDFERFYQNDIEFHRTLWQLSQNRYLAASLETLVVPLFAFFLIRTRLDYKVDLLGSAERHQQLLESIRSRECVRERMMTSLGSSETFWDQAARSPAAPPPADKDVPSPPQND